MCGILFSLVLQLRQVATTNHVHDMSWAGAINLYGISRGCVQLLLHAQLLLGICPYDTRVKCGMTREDYWRKFLSSLHNIIMLGWHSQYCYLTSQWLGYSLNRRQNLAQQQNVHYQEYYRAVIMKHLVLFVFRQDKNHQFLQNLISVWASAM